MEVNITPAELSSTSQRQFNCVIQKSKDIIWTSSFDRRIYVKNPLMEVLMSDRFDQLTSHLFWVILI